MGPEGHHEQEQGYVIAQPGGGPFTRGAATARRLLFAQLFALRDPRGAQPLDLFRPANRGVGAPRLESPEERPMHRRAFEFADQVSTR